MMDDDPKKALKKQQSLKPIAFAATVFSTVAITSCMIAFPLILHYIQTLESNVQLDLNYCKSRARDLWKEMLDIKIGGNKNTERLARIIMTQRRLQKRDTIADFWNRRLHDYQLRDDPVEYTSQTYGTPKPNYAEVKKPKPEYAEVSKPKPDYAVEQSDPYGGKSDSFVETPSVGCKFKL